MLYISINFYIIEASTSTASDLTTAATTGSVIVCGKTSKSNIYYTVNFYCIVLSNTLTLFSRVESRCLAL